MAALPQSEIDYQTAHIHDNLSDTIIGVSAVFTAVAVVGFVTRLVSRGVAGMRLSYDDYLALASVITLIGLDVSISLMAHYGTGRHLVYVLQDPSNLVRIGKAELALEVFYAVCLATSKTSILALYARIFSLRTRFMKIGVWSLTAVNVLLGIATILAIFLECQPLSTVWGDPVECLPSKAESILVAVVNIVLDVAIIALPQPVIWKLNRSVRSRIAISGVFLIGAFATLISIIRIPYLLGSLAGDPFDTTYSLTNGLLFTIIEPAAVVLCGSLPMIPGLFAAWRKSSKSRLADRPSNNYVSADSGRAAFKVSRSTNSYYTRTASTEMVDLEPQNK